MIGLPKTSNDQISQLKMYSYGVVAKAKDPYDWVTVSADGTVEESDQDSYAWESPDEFDIEVIPMEVLPSSNLKVSAEATTLNVKGVDRFGNQYNSSVNASMTMKATWLQFGSNRITPPDVVVGERVMIWQFGSSNKFYWTTLGQDDRLRDQETVVYAIAAKPAAEDAPLTPENTYFFTMSSHNKKIQLSTSTANGEPYGYDFTFDLELGQVYLSDTNGNKLLFDTANTLIRAENRNGTWMELNNDDFNTNAPERTTQKYKNANVTVLKNTIWESSDLFNLITAKMQIGNEGLEPAVLGNQLSKYLQQFEMTLDQHKHIGNMGAPTSPLMALGPIGLSSYWTMTTGLLFSRNFTHF